MIEINEDLLTGSICSELRHSCGAGALEILVVMFGLMEDEAFIKISRKNLASATGWSVSHLAKVLKRLEREGWIERMNPKARRAPSIWVFLQDLTIDR